MILTPYFAKLTGIKFGKICLSPPSRCRGVHGVRYLPNRIKSKFKTFRYRNFGIDQEWFIVKFHTRIDYWTNPWSFRKSVLLVSSHLKASYPHIWKIFWKWKKGVCFVNCLTGLGRIILSCQCGLWKCMTLILFNHLVYWCIYRVDGHHCRSLLTNSKIATTTLYVFFKFKEQD